MVLSRTTAAARHEDGVLAAGQQDARGGEHPGRSSPSGLSNLASTMKMRELGSTDGLMAVTLPVKSRSGIGGHAGDHRHRRFAPAAARCSGVCSCSFRVPIRTMVAILLVSATYSPAATGRAVMKPSKGARMVVSASAFSACASWAREPSSDGLRVLDAAPALPRRVERRFVLLARGVGLRLGGLLLGAGLFVGAARDVAGGHQVRVALGVGGGHASPAPGPIRSWPARPRLPAPGSGSNVPLPSQPMRDCACRSAAVACASCAFAWSSRSWASRWSSSQITCPCWTKSPTFTGVDDHASRDQRSDVGLFVGGESAGRVETGRHDFGHRLRRGHRDALRSLHRGRRRSPTAWNSRRAGESQESGPLSESRFHMALALIPFIRMLVKVSTACSADTSVEKPNIWVNMA